MRGVGYITEYRWAQKPDGSRVLVKLAHATRFGKVIRREDYQAKVASLGLLPVDNPTVYGEIKE